MTEKNGRITEIHIDMKRLKPAVLKEIEDRLGKPASYYIKDGVPQGDFLWALAYAVGRRQDPELTYEEAGELDLVVENVPVPPTGAAG